MHFLKKLKSKIITSQNKEMDPPLIQILIGFTNIKNSTVNQSNPTAIIEYQKKQNSPESKEFIQNLSNFINLFLKKYDIHKNKIAQTLFQDLLVEKDLIYNNKYHLIFNPFKIE
jgi:hypothetical protein